MHTALVSALKLMVLTIGAIVVGQIIGVTQENSWLSVVLVIGIYLDQRINALDTQRGEE